MEGVDDPTDSTLLDRIKASDAAAFEMLYDRHSRSAYGLAYRILVNPEAAEDVVQDAFLTVWRQPASYGAERGTVRSWLLAIVHHRAIDLVRRRTHREDRQQNLDDALPLPDTVDTMEQARQNVEGEQVRQAISQLPPDQQRSVMLAYFGGYTHDEIARQLGVPLGTVKGRLRIGLQKMRGYLHARGLEASG
jgi:RNA polymerase sigma-70 factor (ECF subfamily)